MVCHLRWPSYVQRPRAVRKAEMFHTRSYAGDFCFKGTISAPNIGSVNADSFLRTTTYVAIASPVLAAGVVVTGV